MTTEGVSGDAACTPCSARFPARPAPAACLCAALWWALCWTGAAQAAGEAPGRTEMLAIRAASGSCHYFRVELAVSLQQRVRGLSQRRALAEDAGMLFDFGARPTPVSMWMKDTYLPLDMLFIRADGSIARIERNAEPHSLRRIFSGEPVRAVLEILGGLSGRLGLAAGDRIVHPLFPGATRYCVGE